MTTLRLNPTVAAARAAKRKATADITETLAAQPRPSCEAVGGVPNSGESQPQRRRTVSAIHADLRQRWPALFDPTAPKPLAIGIHKAMRGHGLTNAEIKRGLTTWTKRPAYLQALLRQSLRYDLDGGTSYISAEQAAYAREKVA